MNITVQRFHLYSWLLLIIVVFSAGTVSSDDLNDGIAFDTPIDDSLKTTTNIPFILMKAKAAELREKKGIKNIRAVITQGNQGQGNITFGIGSKIPAGTTVINTSEIKDSVTISR